MYPFSSNASKDEGLRTDSMSSTNGAVAPVVTKHSFESDFQLQELAMSDARWGGSPGLVPHAKLQDLQDEYLSKWLFDDLLDIHVQTKPKMQSGGRTAPASHWLVARQATTGDAKVHDAITHLQHHGVGNTETAAAVAALSVLDPIAINCKIPIPMAAATVHDH